jgi:hypothetical protein
MGELRIRFQLSFSAMEGLVFIGPDITSSISLKIEERQQES